MGEVAPDEYIGEWLTRLKYKNISLRGKHIVDIGSGRYSRTALRFIKNGAKKIILIDLDAVSPDESNHKILLTRDCLTLGLDIDEALSKIEVRKGDFCSMNQPSARDKVDIVLSCAVLEHVYDPGLVFLRSYDWLKPGGITYHKIDLRDHNLSFRYPYEMLTFSEKTWERFFDLRDGFHLNRWRVPNYLKAIGLAGFVNVTFDPYLQDLVGLYKVFHRLDQKFLRIPEDLLSIQGIYLYGEKALS